jgi:hypothetical protein
VSLPTASPREAIDRRTSRLKRVCSAGSIAMCAVGKQYKRRDAVLCQMIQCAGRRHKLSGAEQGLSDLRVEVDSEERRNDKARRPHLMARAACSVEECRRWLWRGRE